MNKIEVPDQSVDNNEFQLEGIDFITNGDQYLTFTLGEENYGIDILVVSEIRGWDSPTLIPNAPAHIKGVTNLRGAIVPIVDLRVLFHLGCAEYKPTTVVIVIALSNEHVERTMGFVVDSVSDVLNADENDVKGHSAFGGSVPPGYVGGLVNVGGDIVTLLNVEQLLNLDDDHAEH
jgi:purine-binding chemotaxis protein CheW